METPLLPPESPLITLRAEFARTVRQEVDAALRSRTERVVLTSPPGFGKTTAVLEALTGRRERCRVLWFTPEAHHQSLAAEIRAACAELLIPAERLYQLKKSGRAKEETEGTGEARKTGPVPQPGQRLWSWPRHGGAAVKLLAHAYLPLLCAGEPHAPLKHLMDADLIVIDEAALPSLVLSFGGPQEGSGTLPVLPLDDLLALMHRHHLLRRDPGDVRRTLAQLLDTAPELSFAYKKGRALTGEELRAALTPLLLPLSSSALNAVRALWQRDADHPGAVYPERPLKALADQLARLHAGAPHGLTLARHPDGVSYLHVSDLHRPLFRQSVLHLDAYPHEGTLRSWLPGARVVDVHAAVRAAGLTVPVTVLRTREARALYIDRQDVRQGRSDQRHRAALQLTAELTGPEPLFIANKQLFDRISPAERALLLRPGQRCSALHWFSGRGRDGFRGRDLIVLNEPRLPRRSVTLDYAALHLDEPAAEAFKEHLEAAEFLQLLFRGRPLSHRDARILCTFSPRDLYRGAAARALLDRAITPGEQKVPLHARKKSEDILGLHQLHLLALAATRAWGGCPVSLLHRYSADPGGADVDGRPAERADTDVLTQRLEDFLMQAGEQDPRLSPGARKIARRPQVQPDLRTEGRPQLRLPRATDEMLRQSGYGAHPCTCPHSGQPGRPKRCQVYARSSEDARRFWQDWPRCR